MVSLFDLFVFNPFCVESHITLYDVGGCIPLICITCIGIPTTKFKIVGHRNINSADDTTLFYLFCNGFIVLFRLRFPINRVWTCVYGR